MPDNETPGRAVYDHTDDEPRRRRRQVADWGVGEELFDGMPGRRFERRRADHRIPRGGADDGRRTIVITESERAEQVEAAGEEFASRDDALRAREQHDAVWRGDEPFALERPVESSVEDVPPLDDVVRGGVPGRRTVKIGGRPPEFHGASSGRRPARTVHERLGPRPDRIAAWAFALGLLLIIIALVT